MREQQAVEQGVGPQEAQGVEARVAPEAREAGTRAVVAGIARVVNVAVTGALVEVPGWDETGKS